jgi:hypothetical protein
METVVKAGLREPPRRWSWRPAGAAIGACEQRGSWRFGPETVGGGVLR